MPDAAHPGTITYKRNEAVIHIDRVEDVPERMRFYDTEDSGSSPPKHIPIVEVDARDMGANQMEILEYGPGHSLLRTTIAVTGAPTLGR